jgi:hypothetical protein
MVTRPIRWSPVSTSVTFCTGPPVTSPVALRPSASVMKLAKPLP